MATAAAAWLSFADTSGAALAAASGSAATARLPGELAGAVDGVAAHGLAPLVPAQLLSAAMAALQARVAHLQAALAPVAAAVDAAAGCEAGEADEDEEQGTTLPEELENALAEALRVRWWRLRGRACSCWAGSHHELMNSPCCFLRLVCTPPVSP